MFVGNQASLSCVYIGSLVFFLLSRSCFYTHRTWRFRRVFECLVSSQPLCSICHKKMLHVSMSSFLVPLVLTVSVPNPLIDLPRYIGELEDVFLSSHEYLEDGGILAFTCELTAPEDCDESKVMFTQTTECALLAWHHRLHRRRCSRFL